VWFESKPSEEMLKRKPIRPKTGRSKEVQKKLKTQCSRSDETGPDRATTVYQWCSPRTVPGAHGHASPAPFFFSSSFAAVQFPARFSVLSCYFVVIVRLQISMFLAKFLEEMCGLNPSQVKRC